ncbi:MAG: SusC/RagA family TonB-linked outer membrane protein, partial [Ferruginibacter sp.]|nr:SusC/RagA family TonB-linked outer membrane protein [Ferruginibacter sp.]
MTRILSLFVMFMLFGVLAFAQTRVVTGKIINDKGVGVPNASVNSGNSSIGTSTSADGSFSIRVASGSTLNVSSVGYETQTVSVGNQGSMDVILKTSNVALQEVVVTTALGITRAKKTIGYAVTKVANAELIQAAPVNLVNGLQGKVSGLNITSLNGGVFEEVKINLRGIRSLTGNNSPLLVLDGVQTPISFLSSLNPQDIADVNVLKGASAAGIYGSDAVNGVFIVTTKRGGTKENPVITLSNTTQFTSVSFFPKFQNQFGSGGSGSYISFENWSWGPEFDGSMKPLGSTLADGTDQLVKYSPNNSRREFFNTGVTTQTDLSFGVKEFYLSLQDAKITGIVPDDRNRRTSIRLNTDKTYNKFKIALNLNYIQQNFDVFDDNAMSDYNSANNVGLNGGLQNLIFNTPGQVPITSYKDFRNGKFSKYNTYFNHYGLNPYIALDNWRRAGKIDDILTNMDLTYKASQSLNFTLRLAGSFKNTGSTNTSKGQVRTVDNVNTNTPVPAGVNESSRRNSRLSTEFFATYNKNVKDFRFNVVAGTYMRENQFRFNSVGATNLVVPNIFNISNGVGGTSGANSISKVRNAAIFGSVGVGYKGWANIELIGRNEWTSLLSVKDDKNQYFFPTVNASLVLSDAIPGLKNNNVLSFLKLRGSYAETGSINVDPYELEATFGANSFGFPYNVPGYTAGNAARDRLLRPEFVKGTEVGVEIGLFKNRVNIEVSAYRQNNSDQVINISTSAATGYTSSTVNAAAFRNEGIDFDLNLTPLVQLGDFRLNVKTNASYNTSEITKIFPGLDRIGIGGLTTAGNFGLVGKPAFVFLASDYKRDAAGRVEVDAVTGVPKVDPTTKEFGRTMPIWIVGLSPSLSYKNVTMTVVGEYRGGHFNYNGIGNDMAWTGVSAVTGQNSRERFVYPNSYYLDATGKAVTNTNVTINDINNFYTSEYRQASSNFITSAASWRVREVSLGYEFPSSVFANQKVIKGLSVSINAR